MSGEMRRCHAAPGGVPKAVRPTQNSHQPNVGSDPSPHQPPHRPFRIALIYPSLPPLINGIGDHTIALAEALSPFGSVDVFYMSGDPQLCKAGVRFQRTPTRNRWFFSASALFHAYRRSQVIVLQFEQFSYGPRGCNPVLPALSLLLKHFCRSRRFVLFAHERYAPTGPRLRTKLMHAYQRAQLRSLLATAHQVLTPVETWVEEFRNKNPTASSVFVPSNIPLGSAEPNRPQHSTHVGVFGALEPHKDTEALRKFLEILPQGSKASYVGKHGTEFLKLAPTSMEVQDLGALSPQGVSDWLKNISLLAAPFHDGISARRGSALAALQHGTPLFTTLGPATDAPLRDAAGSAFFDMGNLDKGGQFPVKDYLDSMSRDGANFYENHAGWIQTVSLILDLDSLTQATAGQRA